MTCVVSMRRLAWLCFLFKDGAQIDLNLVVEYGVRYRDREIE